MMANIDTLDALQLVKGFKLVHMNVRSLVKKIDQIRIMLHESNLDVLSFSETWLKPHINTKIVELKGYKSIRLDRVVSAGRPKKYNKKRGGGLLLYINEKHVANTESLDTLNLSNNHVEAQWVHIHRPACKDVVVCNIYRPPTGNLAKAISYLEDCLKVINLGKTDVFVIGDMNVNYINKKSPEYKKLNFFASSNGLTQCINTTTRVTEKTKSIIDLILTNSKFIQSSGSLDHHISDHQPIYVVHKKSRDRRPTAEFRGRSYRNFDKRAFQNELAEINWPKFYEIDEVNKAWEFLLTQITTILDKMCPIRTFRIKNYRPDWVTNELIEQIKDRDYFYKKAKTTGSKDDWNIAKHLRNLTNSHIRLAKRDFILNELKRNDNNAKKFWKTIKSVLPTGKEGTSDDILLKNGQDSVDRNDVASFINDFFINVGKLDRTLLVQSEIERDEETPLGDSCSCSLVDVTEREVFNVIRSINVSKSSGLENINSTIIKVAFETLVPQITRMYNLSIRTAKFPDSWKKALVVPIPKKGNLTKVQNYRPISLLPLPGKIMEKLVHQYLSAYLEQGSLLAAEQHGFRKDHSTVHSIAQLTSYINKRLDDKFPTLAVFIDFKKAFDCVQHPVLLDKLRAMNLDMSVIDWIDNYLTDRQQRVFANGSYSSYQILLREFPKGRFSAHYSILSMLTT